MQVVGADLPSKLRRGLGQGKVVPAEQIAERLRPFDGDGDGGVTLKELIDFLNSAGLGGIWFCKVVATGAWRAVESNFSEPVTWIKVEVLAAWLHEFMKMKPRAAKRVRITPGGAQGYEPLRYLDGTVVEFSARPAEPSAPVVVMPTPGRQIDPLTRPPPSPRAAPSAAPRSPRPMPGARTPTGDPANRLGPARPAGPRRPGPRR